MLYRLYYSELSNRIYPPFLKRTKDSFGSTAMLWEKGTGMKRVLRKLGLILLGMVIFLLITMGIKGTEFKFRIFMALFAGLSAWMGLISLVIWLWKDSMSVDKQEEKEK